MSKFDQATVLNRKIGSFLDPMGTFSINGLSKALHHDLKGDLKKAAELQRLQWKCTGLLQSDSTFSENEERLYSVGLSSFTMTDSEIINLRKCREKVIDSVPSFPSWNEQQGESAQKYDEKRMQFPAYAAMRQEFAYLDRDPSLWPAYVDHPNADDNKKRSIALNAIIRRFMFSDAFSRGIYDGQVFIDDVENDDYKANYIRTSWMKFQNMSLLDIAIGECDFEGVLKALLIDPETKIRKGGIPFGLILRLMTSSTNSRAKFP